VDEGLVSNATIDNKVTRILTPMFAVGLFDGALPFGELSNNVPTCSLLALSFFTTLLSRRVVFLFFIFFPFPLYQISSQLFHSSLSLSRLAVTQSPPPPPPFPFPYPCLSSLLNSSLFFSSFFSFFLS